MIRFLTLILAVCFCLTSYSVTAQGKFSPAILVDDQIVTGYELDQRTKMLTAFGSRGDTRQEASDQLINERLQKKAGKELNILVTQDRIEDGMAEFASRANLSTEQILQFLATRGVSRQSYRDFVKAGLMWRDVVRTRFSQQAQISDKDVDTALGAGAQGQLSLRVAEILIPYQERGPNGAKALTERLSKTIKSTSAFSAAARKYSRAPTRRTGGLLDWVPASNLPPALVGQLLALETGEVTEPIELQGASGIFQLRGSRRDKSATVSSVVSYAQVPLDSQTGDIKTQTAAARVLINRSDRCLDLQANARKYPGSSYSETSSTQGDLSTSIAMHLAKLDKNEATYYSNSAGGISVIMLCSRTQELPEGERAALRESLFSRKITNLGQGYLQELKSSATIVYK